MASAKKEQRCRDALDLLTKEGAAVFFTLTTPDVVGIDEIRRRWRRLRNWLVRRLGNPAYVMNYELHPGYLQKVVTDKRGYERVIRSDGKSHGWHIHSVFSRFIPLEELGDKIRSFGFGRIDVRRVTSRGVSDYLTKHALKAYRGLSRKERERYPSLRLRLVNASRGLPALSEYRWVSTHLEECRSIFSEWLKERKETPIPVQPRELFVSLKRCEILRLMGYHHLWEWYRFLERVQSMKKNSFTPLTP